MYKILFLSFCFLLIVPESDAQHEPDSLHGLPDAGAWALQFQVLNNFTVGPLSGTSISAKKHIDRQKAWRLGLSLRADINDGNQEATTTRIPVNEVFDPITTTNEVEADGESVFLGLSASYLIFLKPANKVSLYLGGGPAIGVSLASSNSNNASLRDSLRSDNIRESDSEGWFLGGEFVIGAEWFAGKQVSFFAEYGSTLMYNRTSLISTTTFVATDRDQTMNTSTDKSNRFSVRSLPVKMGVSLYFR